MPGCDVPAVRQARRRSSPALWPKKRRTGKLPVISYSRLASILNGCLNFEWFFDETDWRVSNVAEYAIAKSSSWHCGAHQCDRSFADELPMGPRSRASHDTSDTASREVMSRHR
jgi:hypothetical protein